MSCHAEACCYAVLMLVCWCSVRCCQYFGSYCMSWLPGWETEPVQRKLLCDAAIAPEVFRSVGVDIDRIGGAQMMTEGLACDQVRGATDSTRMPYTIYTHATCTHTPVFLRGTYIYAWHMGPAALATGTVEAASIVLITLRRRLSAPAARTIRRSRRNASQCRMTWINTSSRGQTMATRKARSGKTCT